jgi:uncharacterized membrane protein
MENIKISPIWETYVLMHYPQAVAATVTPVVDSPISTEVSTMENAVTIKEGNNNAFFLTISVVVVVGLAAFFILKQSNKKKKDQYQHSNLMQPAQ